MKSLKYLVVAFGALTAVSLASCGDDTTITKLEKSEMKLMASEAVSGIEAIEDESESQPTTPNVGEITTKDSPEVTLVKDLVGKSSVLLENSISIKFGESDREGYSFKNTLTYNENTYTMYVDKYKEKKEKEEKDNKTESESKIKYSGIIVTDTDTYTFKAKEKSEVDDDESEYKLELTIYFDNDENHLVKIKASTETEDDEVETCFSVKYVKNGEETTAFKIKREVDSKETKIKVETEDYEYELTYYSKNGIDYLKLEADDSDDMIYQLSKDTNGNTVYTLVEKN